MKLMFNSIGQSESAPIDNIALRTTFFNTYLNVGNPNGNQAQRDKYNAILKHYARVDADVAVVDETTGGAYNIVVSDLAPDLGYNYVARGVNSNAGSAVMSKYPISNVQELSNSYLQAQGYTDGNEMPEFAGVFRCQITKEGQDVIIYSAHLEPNLTPYDPLVPLPTAFARVIEMMRVFQDIAAQKIINPSAKFIIQGDINDGITGPQVTVYNSQPSGMRSSFTLGSDITFPINYKQFPEDLMTSEGFPTVAATNLDNDPFSLWVGVPNAAIQYARAIDYITTNATLVGRELLDSEATQTGGLAKYGSVLPVGSSQQASDHKMVFADFRI